MRVDTISIQPNKNVALPFLIRGGFYKAEVIKAVGNGLYTLSINGKTVTAASELSLTENTAIFVRVKALQPMPLLELATMEKVLPRVFAQADQRIVPLLRHILQGKIPTLAVESEDTDISSEFLKQVSQTSVPSSTVFKSGDEKTDSVLQQPVQEDLIRREIAANGTFFMSFPYIEHNELHNGYFSYTPAGGKKPEEYRIMADLSNLGTVLAVVRQWGNELAVYFFTETEQVQQVIRDAFGDLRDMMRTAGFTLTALTVRSCAIAHDPMVMLSVIPDERINLVL